jgi:hypothetical protein
MNSKCVSDAKLQQPATAQSTRQISPARTVGIHRLAALPEAPVNIAEIPVDRMITTRQAAEILGLSEETLKKWRQRGGNGLSFLRYPDGAVRYRLSTITKFLDRYTVEH